MRSLIDMAADRGAFIDQSQSLNLFMESPTIGKLSSMYLHAWKQGLKTTYYLRSRPGDADQPDHRRRAGADSAERRRRRREPTPDAGTAERRPTSEAVRLLAREPRVLRGLPLMSDVHRRSTSSSQPRPPPATAPTTPAAAPSRAAARAILDPGLDLTLRPMRYPDVLREVPRRDPQHVDGRGDRLLRRPRRPPAPAAAGRAAPHPAGWSPSSPPATRSSPTTSCSTSTSTSTPPRPGCTCRRQLFEEALHVQFYLTLLDTYIPDHDERAEAFAAIENDPVDPGKAEFCFKWMDSIGHARRAATPRDDRAHVPAQPDLLRRLHRGPVLLRRLRLRLLPALQGPAQRPRRRHQLGVPRRERAHGLRLRGRRHRAPRGARAVRRRPRPPGRRR